MNNNILYLYTNFINDYIDIAFILLYVSINVHRDLFVIYHIIYPRLL